MMTRDEHVAWCKQRAHEYLNRGDTTNAIISMMSDLRKHPETEDHIGIGLGMQLMMVGSLSDIREARRFIDGFN